MILEYKVTYLDGEVVTGVAKQETWYLKCNFDAKSKSWVEGKCVEVSIRGVPHHIIPGPFRCGNPDCGNCKTLTFQIPKAHVDEVIERAAEPVPKTQKRNVCIQRLLRFLRLV